MDFSFSSIDKNAFLIINGTHNYFIDKLMTGASNLLIWLPLSLIIGYLLIKNFNVKTKKDFFKNSLLILFLAVLQFYVCLKFVPYFVESVVQRLSPCYDPYVSKFTHLAGGECSNVYSFLAMRACLAFSIATFLYFALWDKYRAFKILFIVWAILVSYSRIYLGYHFPFNVIVSDLIGIAVGFILYLVFSSLRNRVAAI